MLNHSGKLQGLEIIKIYCKNNKSIQIYVELMATYDSRSIELLRI